MVASEESAQSDPKDSDPSWRIALEVIGPAVTISGVVIYGLLYMAYTQFFGQLGVDPNDVGFGYARTLTTSVGVVVWLGAYSTLFACTALYWRWWFRTRGNPPSRIVRFMWLDHPVITVNVLIAVGLVWLAFFLPKDAQRYAEEVKRGHAVTPRNVGPIVFINTRAVPALIEPKLEGESTGAGRPAPGKRPQQGIASLTHRSLLYLGQSGGTIVVYDHQSHQAIYIPSSEVVLRIQTDKVPSRTVFGAAVSARET